MDGVPAERKQRGGKRGPYNKVGKLNAAKEAKVILQPQQSRSPLIDALSKPNKDAISKERRSKLQEKKDEKMARRL